MRKLIALVLTLTVLGARAESTSADSLQAPQYSATQLSAAPGPVITRVAGSLALNAAITEAFKGTVHKLRPQSVYEHNSFPSRHTSWAFTASTILSNEFGARCPWISVAAQSAATALGVTRVSSLRHYGSDVAAGAAIGILSTEAAYAITGLIFRDSSRRSLYPVDGALSGLSSSSLLLIPVDARLGSGWGLRVDPSFAVSSHWSIGPAAEWMAFSPHGDYFADKYSYLAVLAAARYSLPLGSRVLFETDASAGPYFGLKEQDYHLLGGPPRHSADIDDRGLDAGIGVDVLLRWSPRLASRAGVGYKIMGRRRFSSMISFSIGAVACF